MKLGMMLLPSFTAKMHGTGLVNQLFNIEGNTHSIGG
ncbi:Uncharacterised protein [Vibrio cholerae]|nr:Uncharacterised protein [Vibrio cholerae]